MELLYKAVLNYQFNFLQVFFYLNLKVGGQWKLEMVTLTENFERRLQVRVTLMILLLILRLFVMLMQEAGKRSKELKGKIADLKVSIHHQENIFKSYKYKPDGSKGEGGGVEGVN